MSLRGAIACRQTRWEYYKRPGALERQREILNGIRDKSRAAISKALKGKPKSETQKHKQSRTQKANWKEHTWTVRFKMIGCWLSDPTMTYLEVRTRTGISSVTYQVRQMKKDGWITSERYSTTKTGNRMTVTVTTLGKRHYDEYLISVGFS
jgi:hypothetical protein